MKNRVVILLFDKQNILFGASTLDDAENIIGANTTQEITDSCDNKTTTSSGYSYRYAPDDDTDYVKLMGEMILGEFDQMN